jgi:hypothetical protein
VRPHRLDLTILISHESFLKLLLSPGDVICVEGFLVHHDKTKGESSLYLKR